LRQTEQNATPVTAYMNLIRDTAILESQRRNIEVLQEPLR
jgi:outer membrane protein